jgi:hypothetical protein
VAGCTVLCKPLPGPLFLNRHIICDLFLLDLHPLVKEQTWGVKQGFGVRVILQQEGYELFILLYFCVWYIMMISHIHKFQVFFNGTAA